MNNIVYSGDSFNFIWKGKDYDVKGSGSSGASWMKVEYKVEKGKGQVLIARRGQNKGDAVIVLSDNPTKSAQIAAAELNYYIEKMTGVKLTITTDKAKVPFAGAKILVGESSLTRVLGLRNCDLEDQQYIICTYGNILVLMGKDEEEYGVIDYQGTGLWENADLIYDWSLKPEKSKQIGTIYAVDTFLEKFCGIRWYMPGELGEVCPKKESIVVENIDLKLKPWSSYRSIGPYLFLDYFHFIGSGNQPVSMSIRDINLWLMRMKLFGIEAYNANHSLVADWFKQRFPDKKEIFAKGSGNPTQLCLTNRELLKIVCNDADDYFSGKTNYERSYGEYFCVMPHDTHEYCQCSECQKLIKTQKEIKGYGFWNDMVSNYVWSFVNEVAKYVKKEHPGKWVSCCVYAGYFLLPDKIKFSDNVAVTICRVLIDGIKSPEYKKFYQEEIKKWAKAVNRWYIWEYFDHIQGNEITPSNFPGIFIHEIAEDIKFLKENGCRGIFNELSSVGGRVPNFTLDHLNVYVQLKLLDDAYLNVDEIFDEYCKLFYGPAYEPMKQFFMKIEERYTNPDNWKLREEDTDANWDRICPLSELKKFEELINKATLLAKEEPYSTRVKLIKEAVYGMMEKNCYKHFVLMKSTNRKLFIPYVENKEEMLKGKKNHIDKFLAINGENTDTKTEAWLGYDKENLYITVKCYEEDMSKVKAVIKPDDKAKMMICCDDTIEVFIDVGRTRERYIQILGNTNGAINVGKYEPLNNGDFSMVFGISSKVEKIKEGWMITFTIPLKEINVIIKKGDIWGLNICRDRPREGKLPQDIWTCWCPTGTGFHQPAKFGIIEFE